MATVSSTSISTTGTIRAIGAPSAVPAMTTSSASLPSPAHAMTATGGGGVSGGSMTLSLRRSLVPPKWEETVRVLGMAESREAALTLAHAFAADDYARYLVDTGEVALAGGAGAGGLWGAWSAEEKWRLHVDILHYSVASHVLSGLAMTVGPEVDAVALWLPPGKHDSSWLTHFRSGLWRLQFRLSSEGRRRYFDEIIPLLHDTKTEVLGPRDNDAWYLVYLGTKPSSQGKGYGRKLLENVMAKADAQKRPIYLESSSAANNAYYAKFGFEVRREIALERGTAPVRLSIMVREPGAASAVPVAAGVAGRKARQVGGRLG